MRRGDRAFLKLIITAGVPGECPPLKDPLYDPFLDKPALDFWIGVPNLRLCARACMCVAVCARVRALCSRVRACVARVSGGRMSVRALGRVGGVVQCGYAMGMVAWRVWRRTRRAYAVLVAHRSVTRHG